MESQHLTGHIPQNYEGRGFFKSGSSSYQPEEEEEVQEIPQPACWVSNSRSVKQQQKKMTDPGLIYIDLDDHSSDVMLVNELTDRKDKGKAQMTDTSNDHYNSVNTRSGSWIPCNTVTSSDSETHSESYDSDDVYCWEDDHDQLMTSTNEDKLALFQSRLDSMDIPAGVEAAIPWFPDYEHNMHVQSSSLGLNISNGAVAQSSATPMDMLDGEFPSLPVKNNESSSTVSSSKARMHKANKTILRDFHGEAKSSVKFHPAHPIMKHHFMSQQPSYNYSVPFSFSSVFVSNPPPPGNFNPPPPGNFNPPPPGNFNPPPPGNFFPGAGWGDYASFGQDQFNISLDAAYTNLFEPVNIHEANLYSTGVVHEEPSRPVVSLPSNSSPEEILRKYQEFKRFDTVEDHSDHYFAHHATVRQPTKAWSKKMQDEWRVLEKDLPDNIFVRVYESRMDLLRAVIIGAEGTPYHDGLFFFDVYFPADYPNIPPNVFYHSGGLRINPNLYNCGKVCLSLLNTWSGSGNEKWVPGLSTMLQVLVSIQALVLNAKPYFNEPGYAGSERTSGGEKQSLNYNNNTFTLSLKTILYTLRRPAKYFEDLILGHFYNHGEDILAACQAYKNGAQVGSFTKNQASNVVSSQGQNNINSSGPFKHTLVALISQLVQAFTQIGLNDCQKFLNPPPPPPPPITPTEMINKPMPSILTATVPKKKQRMAMAAIK